MRTKHLIASGLAAIALLVVAGCGGGETTTATFSVDAPSGTETDAGGASADAGAADAPKPKVEVPSGPAPKELVSEDLKVGTGAAAKAGDDVEVNYVGVSYSNGKEFDASYGRAPFTFTLGQGSVIPGWDEGVVGMKVGGRRKLVIPPDLAYGAQGSPPAIGPNETLVFVIDLLGIQ
jgi:peptidylprolyl isomerase